MVKTSDVIIRDGWDWGEVVTGSLQRVQRETKEAVKASVNVLAVRKKETAMAVNTLQPRKREDKPVPVVNTLQSRKEEAPVANVLSGRLVRKREDESAGEPKVNVLAGEEGEVGGR